MTTIYQTVRHTTVKRKDIPESAPEPQASHRNRLEIVPTHQLTAKSPSDLVLVDGVMTRKAAEALKRVLALSN